jgi:hypothetical protein
MAPVVVTVPVMMVAPVVVVMMVMVLVAIVAVLAPTPILPILSAVFAAILVHGVWMRGRAVIRRVLSQNAACKAADRHRQNQLMQSV